MNTPQVRRAAQYIRQKYQVHPNEIYLDKFETEFKCKAVLGDCGMTDGLIIGFEMDEKAASLFLLKWS